jgi:hypothetical protein
MHWMKGSRLGLIEADAAQCGRQTLRRGQTFNDHQQGADTAALLVEGIGGNSGRTSSPENAPLIAITRIEGKR